METLAENEWQNCFDHIHWSRSWSIWLKIVNIHEITNNILTAQMNHYTVYLDKS